MVCRTKKMPERTSSSTSSGNPEQPLTELHWNGRRGEELSSLRAASPRNDFMKKRKNTNREHNLFSFFVFWCP
jgi:hypothetical protein